MLFSTYLQAQATKLHESLFCTCSALSEMERGSQVLPKIGIQSPSGIQVYAGIHSCIQMVKQKEMN